MNMVMALLATPAIIVAAPGGVTVEQPSTCDGGDGLGCRYILDATSSFANMLVTANPAPLQRHLDPRAIWVSSEGEVRSGAQLIDLVRHDMRRTTARLDHAQVRFFANVAVVTWQESWTAPAALVKAGRLAGVDTWVRRGRTWMVVSTVETRLKP